MNQINHIDYQVISVLKTESPVDPKESWYAYTISNPVSTITGQRQGNLKQVTEHAKEYAQQLNDRMHNGGSYYRPKKGVAAKAS